MLFTIGRALSSGRREALLTVVGNALGILTQICALAVGLGPLIAASATAYTALKVVGAGYLIWLGVQAIRHRKALAEAFDAGVPVATPSLHARAGRLRRGRDQPQDDRVLRGPAAAVRGAELAGVPAAAWRWGWCSRCSRY